MTQDNVNYQNEKKNIQNNNQNKNNDTSERLYGLNNMNDNDNDYDN